MKAEIAMLAAYNRWANTRLYEASGKVSDADYRKTLGAPIASLHRRLSHVLVADRVWMHRFTGEGTLHASLDELPFDTLGDLTAARREEDDRIITWIETLAPSSLQSLITYRPLSEPDRITQPLMPLLFHFFNHQTHHRGQVHGLLTAIAGDKAAPAIDLIYFLRGETSA
jgi:uncharacterized damage-inducible protein DinB